MLLLFHALQGEDLGFRVQGCLGFRLQRGVADASFSSGQGLC